MSVTLLNLVSHKENIKAKQKMIFNISEVVPKLNGEHETGRSKNGSKNL